MKQFDPTMSHAKIDFGGCEAFPEKIIFSLF